MSTANISALEVVWNNINKDIEPKRENNWKEPAEKAIEMENLLALGLLVSLVQLIVGILQVIVICLEFFIKPDTWDGWPDGFGKQKWLI